MVGDERIAELLARRRAGRGDRRAAWCGRRWTAAARTTSPRIVFRLGEVDDAADRVDARDPDDRPRPAATDDDGRTRGGPAGATLFAALGRSPWSRCWRSARSIGAAPEPLRRRRRVAPAASRSTRACRGSCSPASSSTTRCASTSITVRLPRSADPQGAVRSPPALRIGCGGRDQADRGGLSVRSRPRTRELWNLLWVAAAHRHRLPGGVHRARSRRSRAPRWSTPGFFFALYAIAHLGLRAGLPGRRPVAAAAGGAA